MFYSGNKYIFRSISMEIFIGLVILAGIAYWIVKNSKPQTNAKTEETQAPYKVETPVEVRVVAGDIAFTAPAETEVATKPAKKTRTTKPKAPKAEAKPKVEAKSKAPRKPKMKVAK